MSQLETQISLCPQCGAAVSPGELACPVCGRLLYVPRLQELSQQAQWMEQQDPIAAAALWRQCLELLPPHSPQAEMLRHRIAGLEGVQPIARPPIGLGGAIARTLGSMIISIAVYATFMGPSFAAGFVLLILVHEMGHIIALRNYGIRSSPPIFLPFIGAIITVPSLRNAKEEAIVGIGGPVLGTVGALVCFGLYLALHHNPLLLNLAYWGFAINLLNLLPIPPLDGGRVTAAVSPWIWPLGLLGLVGMLVYQWVNGGFSPVLLLILIIAAPRMWRTFRYRERMANYYQIARSASWAIGCSYVFLAAVLVTMFYYAQYLGAQ
jgi:Zn-dependent protease